MFHYSYQIYWFTSAKVDGQPETNGQKSLKRSPKNAISDKWKQLHEYINPCNPFRSLATVSVWSNILRLADNKGTEFKEVCASVVPTPPFGTAGKITCNRSCYPGC